MAPQSILSMIGRGRGPETPEQQRPAAAVPPVPSASERRLRLVVESAPVSLCILDPEGKVLAANKAALTLLGIDRLHDVIGTALNRLVVADGRERFTTFVTNVCHGEAGTLQYELTAPDGTARSVETRAVPLRREANATAAFLGVTWDVSERKHAAAAMRELQQKWEQLEAQRSAERKMWDEALRSAKESHKDESTVQPRVEALNNAEERHVQLTAQLTAERDALLGKLTDAEERRQTMATQLLNHENSHREALDEAERTYQASLAARVAAHWRLEQTLDDRTAERDALQEAVTLARTAYDVVVEEKNRLQAELAEVEGRREHQAGESAAEWTAESDALLRKLTDAEERREALAAQLIDQQNIQRASLEEAERTYHASLAARAEAHRQIEQTLDHRTKERDALQEGVKRTQSAYDLVAEEKNQIRATLAEVEARHERRAAEWAAHWTAERDALLVKLTHAGERCETLAAQLLIEQNLQRTSLAEAERTYQASLTARVDAHRQIEQTLEHRTKELDALQEAVKHAQSAHDIVVDERNQIQATLAGVQEARTYQAAEWAAERDGLLTRLIAIEHAQREIQAALAARSSENEQLKQEMHSARISFEEILSESRAECAGLTTQLHHLQRHTAAVAERWQTELAETLGPLDKVSASIERLLHEGRNALEASGQGRQQTEEEPEQPVRVSADASSDVEADEEASWRF